MLGNLSSWASRVCLCVLVSFFGVSLFAAPPLDKDKVDGKQLLAYLPIIRSKVLLDNERRYVADMEKCYKLYDVLVNGGAVTVPEAARIEEEVLRGRLRLLRHETAYRDSLDQYTHRFTATAESRRRMEDAIISPLATVFRRFEKLFRASEKVRYKLAQLDSVEDAAKLRPAVVELLTTSALVKDTSVPKRFRKRWKEWTKIDTLEKVREKVNHLWQMHFQLRPHRADEHREEPELLTPPGGKKEPQKKKAQLPTGQLRAEDLYFEILLGSLELSLREYEAQPWKKEANEIKRQVVRNTLDRPIVRYSLAIGDRGYSECLADLVRSWPALAETRLKDVDLLTCKMDEAEQTVASLLKTPEARLAGKKKLRLLRILAKSYRIQQRLFALAFSRREQLKSDQYSSKDGPLPPSSLPAADTSGAIVHIASVPPRPLIESSAFEASRAIDVYRSLSRAKRQLLQSWIDYQMERLDLYHDLGLSPP